MKFRIGSNVIVIFLSFCLIIFISCKKIIINDPNDLKDVLKEGRLKVITDKSIFGFEIEGDSIYGFQYEMIKAFADSLGVELQISEQNNIAESLLSLENGENDIIASVIPVIPEYNQFISFSETILTARLMLVQRVINDTVTDKNVLKQSDLANDTIYLPTNSPYIMRIKNLSDEIAELIHIKEMDNVNNEDLIRMVSEGKIKNTICQDKFTKRYKTLYSNLDFSLPLGFNQNYSWVVNKNSTYLLEKLNSFLNEFIGSKDYWNLYNKYY